jgi:uncharacterized membrane protein YfcA
VRTAGRARYDRRPVGAAEIAAIAAAGMAAGAINTLVGSGTLITFPVLLAFGYSPVTANVSNTVGLVPGSVSGAIGYRRELEGLRTRTLRFAVASVLGGITGAVLLLVLPASAFEAIVPAFIAVALVAVVRQPRLDRLVARRPPARERAEERAGRRRERSRGAGLHRRRRRGLGPAALIAARSVLGAQLAARYGRRLSPQALRAVIVIVGIAAIVQLLT